MELYAQVRRSVYVDGISEREATSRFGIARETVRMMLRYETPTSYQRSNPTRRAKLGPYTGIIDQVLADDREQPRKRRHHEVFRRSEAFDAAVSDKLLRGCRPALSPTPCANSGNPTVSTSPR